jgi:hypothetical protein
VESYAEILAILEAELNEAMTRHEREGRQASREALVRALHSYRFFAKRGVIPDNADEW